MRFGIIIVTSLFLGACFGGNGSSDVPGAGKGHKGGYYLDDRPPAQEEYRHNIAQIPNAVPRVEPLSRTGNKPYTALGKKYYPKKTSVGYAETGYASWYGMRYHGNRTSSGEAYDIWKMTAAHPTLPLPSYVEVTNLDNGRKVVVKVNDRGPFLRDRIIDLSYVAARKLGIVEKGTGRVHVRALQPKRQATVANSTQKQAASQKALKFYLQFGAFSVVENALRLRQRLSRLQYPVYPASQQAFVSQGAPYRVLLGPFADANVAYENKARLKRLFRQDIHMISDY